MLRLIVFVGIIGNEELVDEFNKYYEKIMPISLFYSDTSPDARLVTKKLKQFYFGDKQLSNETMQSAVDVSTRALVKEVTSRSSYTN